MAGEVARVFLAPRIFSRFHNRNEIAQMISTLERRQGGRGFSLIRPAGPGEAPMKMRDGGNCPHW